MFEYRQLSQLKYKLYRQVIVFKQPSFVATTKGESQRLLHLGHLSNAIPIRPTRSLTRAETSVSQLEHRIAVDDWQSSLCETDSFVALPERLTLIEWARLFAAAK